MSHVVTIQTEVRDSAAIAAACARLKLLAPVYGRTRLYSGHREGWIVLLPGWTYPCVLDTTFGKVHFDNFAGNWGDPKELDKFLQAYAVEKARLEARKRGHTVTEQPLADGSIKLTIEVAGGAA